MEKLALVVTKHDKARYVSWQADIGHMSTEAGSTWASEVLYRDMAKLLEYCSSSYELRDSVVRIKDALSTGKNWLDKPE